MGRLKALLTKEFIQMRRDRLTFAMIIGIPVIQLLIFGFAINTEVKHLPTAVFDQSLSREGRELLDAFVASGDPAQALAEMVESHACDAVFMSTRGGGLRSAVLGSVSQDMVQRSSVPVTLVKVPEDAQPD